MSPLHQIVFVIVAGTACQLLGWRLNVPSILLLLLTGIVAGPIAGLLSPDTVLGSALLPLVELAVAVILFEGGLSLKKSEMGQIGRHVIRVVTLTAFVSWIGLWIASRWILELPHSTASVLGAILIVSGPTVVIPLLRLLRARAPVEPLLRWEGILIDPIGVVLATLVAEVAQDSLSYTAPLHILGGMLASLSIGAALGWLGYVAVRIPLRKHIIPDQFIIPYTLAVLFASVSVANLLHEQSGLLTSTLMGLLLARLHQNWVSTIENFINPIQRLLIGILFIVLAARINPQLLTAFDWTFGFFILIALCFIRPVAVVIGLLGTSFTIREILAVGFLAPRGIVSAVLASSLSAPLIAADLAGAEKIVPYTFGIIIGSVVFYGLISPIIFRALMVREGAREGILCMGTSEVAFAFAKILNEHGLKVLFVDTNPNNVARASRAGFDAYHGNILHHSLQEDVNFEGIGKLLAWTSNEEANSLASIEFQNLFGSANVFQVPTSLDELKGTPHRTSGRTFAADSLTFDRYNELWNQGYRIRVEEKEVPEGGYLLGEIDGKKLLINTPGIQLTQSKGAKITKKIIFAR